MFAGWLTILFYMALSLAASYAIAELTRKDIEGPKDALPGKFESPSIEEGVPYPVVFGMPKRIESPTMAWWGDILEQPIWDNYREPSGPFNTKRKWFITGYKHYMGVHFIPCHGVIDGIKQIWVGEKILWPSLTNENALAADGETSISLNAPEFFGGDDSAGGIKGDVDIQLGEADQARNTYLESVLGSNISAYRGLVSVILNKVYIGKSPFPKAWSFLVKRTQVLDDGTEQWYIAKADIHNDLNPIHMLRECFTNTRWGMGYSTSLFDSTIWEAAADTLYDEDFGISRLWRKDTESLEDLIADILRHINAVVYQDPQTGEVVVKLLRDDYVDADLTVYDNSDILELKDYIRPSLGEIPNVFQMVYSDIIANKSASIPDQDIALINQQGGKMLPVKFIYGGITKSELAGRVLARDRAQVTSMTASMSLICKRTMSSIMPGDVFKITMSSHSIASMIVRVLPDAKYGTLADGRIRLKVVEDIFSIEDSLFDEAPDSDWLPPYSDAVAATSFLQEAPFWTLLKIYGLSLVQLLDEDSGFLQVGAAAPSDDSINYELLVRNGLTLPFNSKARMVFTAAPLTQVSMPLNAEDMVLTFDASLYGIVSGSYAVIDDEIVKVTIDVATGGTESVIVSRGCLDTVPAAHDSGTRMWFIENVSFIDGDELTAGDQPGVKILTKTANGQLDSDDATIDNADEFDSRQDRPYPPGNFLINGESYPDEFDSSDVDSGEDNGVTISWSHRDRLSQKDYIVEHDAGDIGPEAGVTYTVKIYDEDDVLCHTETDIEGTEYKYTEAQEIIDCGELQDQLRFVLYSVRGDA